MRATRRTLVATAAVATLAVACPPSDQDPAALKAGRGLLVVQLETRGGGPIPDGAYVRIEAPRKVLVQGRIDSADIVRNVKAGKYQIVAWHQSCEDCTPNVRCGDNVVVPDRGRLRVVILMDPASSCAITTP